MVKNLDSGANFLGLKLGSATYPLCDLEQVPQCLCAPVPYQ